MTENYLSLHNRNVNKYIEKTNYDLNKEAEFNKFVNVPTDNKEKWPPNKSRTPLFAHTKYGASTPNLSNKEPACTINFNITQKTSGLFQDSSLATDNITGKEIKDYPKITNSAKFQLGVAVSENILGKNGILSGAANLVYDKDLNNYSNLVVSYTQTTPNNAISATAFAKIQKDNSFSKTYLPSLVEGHASFGFTPNIKSSDYKFIVPYKNVAAISKGAIVTARTNGDAFSLNTSTHLNYTKQYGSTKERNSVNHTVKIGTPEIIEKGPGP